MKRPPMLMTLRFCSYEDAHNHEFTLFIPLFIIMPFILLILLALALLALPFLFIYVLVTWNLTWWKYLRYGVPVFFETMHSLLGLKVDVEDPKQKIYIEVN